MMPLTASRGSVSSFAMHSGIAGWAAKLRKPRSPTRSFHWVHARYTPVIIRSTKRPGGCCKNLGFRYSHDEFYAPTQQIEPCYLVTTEE
jgi:hypothetical protein